MANKFQVYSTKCEECLFTKYKLVPNKRRKEIIAECLQKGKETFFVCHKSSQNGGNVCCKGFYDLYGNRVTIVQLAERLHFIELIEQD
jgi:hypothetical protein